MLKKLNDDGTPMVPDDARVDPHVDPAQGPGGGPAPAGPTLPRRYTPGAIDKQLKENRGKTSLDKMGSEILSIMILSGLTNQEMAALLSGAMMAICQTDKNRKVLEGMGLDTNDLEIALEIQKIWTLEYAGQFDPKD